MVIELVIILLLLWIYTNTPSHEAPKTHNLVQEKIEELRCSLDLLLSEFEVDNVYTLNVSTTRSYTLNKKDIYMVIQHPIEGYVFDDDTLLLVAVHELSHTLCADRGHSELFEEIEEQLVTLAVEKGLIDDEAKMDPKYPCLDD